MGCGIHLFHKGDAGGSEETCPDTQMDKEKRYSVVVRTAWEPGARVQIPAQRLGEERDRVQG